MADAKDIDAIDNFFDILRIMTSLGISLIGLRTLDEMKDRVKETLKISEKKKSSWTAKEVRLCRVVLVASISQNQSGLMSDLVPQTSTDSFYCFA